MLYCKNSYIYVGYNDGIDSGGVSRSTNYGIDWTNVNTGLPSRKIMALTTSGNNLFTSEYDAGVYLSTDDGANWNITGITVEYIYGFATIGTNIFAASTENGVYLSTNNGTSWNLVNSGLTNVEIRAIYAKGSDLFVGTRGGGVFLSTNNGSSWAAVNAGLTMKYVYALTSVGSNLLQEPGVLEYFVQLIMELTGQQLIMGCRLIKFLHLSQMVRIFLQLHTVVVYIFQQITEIIGLK